MEWGHRALGRAVGLVWAAGFLGFSLTGRLPPGWGQRLLGLGALGGLQGVIGWWMVRSGLKPGMEASPRGGSPSTSAWPSFCSG